MNKLKCEELKLIFVVFPQEHVCVSMKLDYAVLRTPPQNLDVEPFRRCSAIKESTFTGLFLWVFVMN